MGTKRSKTKVTENRNNANVNVDNNTSANVGIITTDATDTNYSNNGNSKVYLALLFSLLSLVSYSFGQVSSIFALC